MSAGRPRYADQVGRRGRVFEADPEIKQTGPDARTPGPALTTTQTFEEVQVMAEKSYHKTAEERVESIREHLKTLQHGSDFLLILAKHKNGCEIDPVELSVDTLFFFANIMGMAVDTLSAELGVLKYEGKPHAEAFVRKPQAPGPEVFELDPITRENLIKDVEKLAGMSPELQLMAESICEDLGLPLPEAIQERIARDKGAQVPEPEPRKLNHYTPGLANAKVSLKAMWGYLEDLELAADDPAKVSAWAEMIHDELEKCAAA
jgi:hypothetical protein